MTTSEWIRIEDRLPCHGGNVLVFYDNSIYVMSQGSVDGEWFDENGFYDDSGLQPTHWMPLPEVPEVVYD